MKISIMIPAYNAGRYREKAIEGRLNQDYADKEVVVVDGGSKDGTVELLKSYGDRLKWVSEKDEGQTDAINKGLKMISGEICAYLNADDFYEPGIFTAVAEVFANQPDVVLVYGDCRFHKESGEAYILKPKDGITAQELVSRGSMIYQPGTFYRTSAMRKIGPLKKELDYFMDYDLDIRLLQNGKSKYLPIVSGNFLLREGQKSGSQNNAAMRREILSISKGFGGKRFSRLHFSVLKSYLPSWLSKGFYWLIHSKN